MTLSVKRIYGKLYVYDQWREDGRIVSRYIGPLEKIIDSHRVVKPLDHFNYNDLGLVIDKVLNAVLQEVVNVNYSDPNVVIDSLIREISRVVVSFWCGGWGLNPRRPTPSGPKPDPFDLARAPPHFP